MSALLVALGIVFGLVVLGFAAIGMWGCWVAVSSSARTRRRKRIAQHVRQAEDDVIEINRRAQDAILAVALERLRFPPSQGGGER